MAKGIIYVMNTCVDGLVKIGRTGTNNFEQRMTLLESNGYRRISVLTREFAIEVEDYEEKEKLLHELFSKSRVGNSELFSVDVNLVKQLMASFEGKVIYPKDEKKEEIFVQATEEVEVKKGVLPDGQYTLKIKTKGSHYSAEATMTVEDGKLFIESGAKLAPITKKLTKGWVVVRESAKINGYTTEGRIECTSPSMAATIVCGHPQNGWIAWKTANGDSIDMYRHRSEVSDPEEE